ncbi:VapE domain-containing protein [Microvirga alba]|uniref:PriCT-2 domain-containing protein n=1 Tax=Microvirga alba TaxID=2791025 RepID=A0A931FQ76_9HYPH|nr:VapE domain-containing protein [Microvirga alba]MBF9235565.1 PriCT-2 domain-containing protein [Microvirga alba]
MMGAAKNITDLTIDTIEAALGFIDPNLSRDKWARIGMALKSELGDSGFDLFDKWSATGEGYNARDCRDTWKSIRTNGGVNIGTLIFEAQQQGFQLSDQRATLSAEQIEQRTRKREEEAARAAAELKRAQGEAAKLANLTWDSASHATAHPYLDAKRVRAHGLCIGDWPLINEKGEVFRRVPGALLVPILDVKNGKVISLQGIMADADGSIQKRYLRNGRKKGGFHMIGRPPAAGDVLAFCEGYATGATIHELTGWTVIVTFDAPNLPVVAKAMRETFPNAAFIICADNDAWTKTGDIENPGVHYAKQAAQESNGFMLVPKFQDTTTRPTDFNDLAALEGDDLTRAQLVNNPITAPKIPASVPAVAANDNVDFFTPLIDVNSKGKPLATIENVREVCSRLGVTVRYNVITKEEEILIPGESFSIDNRANASYSRLESQCAKFNMPTDKLGGFITYLADQNLYNPVASWITSKPWDGKPRLQQLCDTVVPVEEKRLPDGRRLSDVLITRWMMSAVAGAFSPDGVSAHGILVLQGEQYLGKTMWFKQLVPADLQVLQDGMILRPDDRDSVKQICSFWLVELGELDATFRKADIAALKSFITRKQDVLRRAYARKESTFARRTVFFGSVNPREYLHDVTGNRRYWTIECKALNHQHGLDMQQVWAEALHLYRQGEGYYLTPDEMAALNNHNEQFMAIDPIEERLQTRLAWEAARVHWTWKTSTEILLKVGVERPNQADATKCAHIMRKLNGGEGKRSHGKNLLLCPPGIDDDFEERPF